MGNLEAVRKGEWMEQKKDWKDIKGIGMVIRTSTEKGNKGTDTRYFISSIGNDIE